MRSYCPPSFQFLLEAAELVSSVMQGWDSGATSTRHDTRGFHYAVSHGWDRRRYHRPESCCYLVWRRKAFGQAIPAGSQRAGLMPSEGRAPDSSRTRWKTQDGGMCWVSLPAIQKATEDMNSSGYRNSNSRRGHSTPALSQVSPKMMLATQWQSSLLPNQLTALSSPPRLWFQMVSR